MKEKRYRFEKCHSDACRLGRWGRIAGRSVTKESVDNVYGFISGITITKKKGIKPYKLNNEYSLVTA